jgi:hypothetical protein
LHWHGEELMAEESTLSYYASAVPDIIAHSSVFLTLESLPSLVVPLWSFLLYICVHVGHFDIIVRVSGALLNCFLIFFFPYFSDWVIFLFIYLCIHRLSSAIFNMPLNLSCVFFILDTIFCKIYHFFWLVLILSITLLGFLITGSLIFNFFFDILPFKRWGS